MNISSMLSHDSNVPPPPSTATVRATATATTTSTTTSPQSFTTTTPSLSTTSLQENNVDISSGNVAIPGSIGSVVPTATTTNTNTNTNTTVTSSVVAADKFTREDSIVSDIISPHTNTATSIIDVDYKNKFESNFHILNQLDKFQTLSQNLKLLKFDEIKLNNFIINTNKFTSNYIDRVIAEDISSRNNKISDTNKSKELTLIDYSKPLHHNTTRGKEFKWGSTREIHKIESKKKKRVVSSTGSANGSTGPVLIKPKPSDQNITVRRSTRPKPKRKLDEPEEEGVQEEDEDDEGSHKKIKLEDGKLKIKLAVKPVNVNSKEYKAFLRQYDNTCIAIWKDMSRKDGPKASRLMQQSTQAKLINLKKTSILAAREAKRWQLKNNKNQKDLTTKARRAMREMFNFWKRNERIERELRKKYEKELLDKAKREEEEREAKRQSRKLNFLITQTELYSHFIGKKIKTDEIEGSDSDPNLIKNDRTHLDKYSDIESKSHDINNLDFENEDDDALHRAAAQNAQNALELAQSRAKQFNEEEEPLKNPDTNGEEMNFQNPTLLGDITIPQPAMLTCTLKEYQIKGLNWLANLYEQGINGILADEMGLGKTVQSISVLAYLAETHNIWGPFLVVTPASTLHNWQQEISRFVPNFKVLPYWGNAKDRKILRKFWDRKSLRYTKDSPFHVLVTSYQLVVADSAYFQKMKWQYMILDEAQAIKSSQSSRWKSLLSFSCRNRLLLTGTPIQNSMQELWALLHFIMPSLFDSHDEFSDWFSKDIESHAQSNTNLDEQQLRRLHVILKPFMLRRIKKNVQSELGDKKEIDIFCDLTNRQQKYYQMLRSQISIMDLLDSSISSNNPSDDTTSLINLVMQFRKVCNHPDLFERADVKSPFSMGKFAETSSFLRETNELEMNYTTENIINYNLPRLIYDEMLTPSETRNSKDSIYEMFNIYRPENQSFEWLHSINVSPQELNQYHKTNIIERAIDLMEYTDINYSRISRFNYMYEGEYTPSNKKLLIYYNKFSNITNSSILTNLYSIQDQVYQDMFINIMSPASEPLASAPPITILCSSRNFQYKQQDVLFNERIRSSLLPMSLSQEYQLMMNNTPLDGYPKSNMLPVAINSKIDYSNIRMPSMNRFITESGKLSKLDELLLELKQNDHRVLIYFQMTRMMDLMEEYLTYRQHKYIRLDGSSKLDDRRDLVHDWQTKPELFIFLLSTRAGGLGINLTAADTVIFYDSDWNPTIDSQAMDRAHRLGQTKQVTVYRLLTRGTIEERMRDRAKQKEQVQQVVMEGKATLSKKEEHANKKKDVAFLLLGGDSSDVSSGKTSTNSTPEPENENKKYRVSADDALTSKKLQELYHEGEGEFSGNVTPAP